MSHHGVVNQQHHDRTNDCDNHAVNVQARYTRCSKEAKKESANESAYNAKSNIEPKALALMINDLGSDEAGDRAEYDPADDAHVNPASIATSDASYDVSRASFAFRRSIVGFSTSLTPGSASTLSKSRLSVGISGFTIPASSFFCSGVICPISPST